MQTVVHSFLGVGAPEAILVAVVALVVFGPKGLADVSAAASQQGAAVTPQSSKNLQSSCMHACVHACMVSAPKRCTSTHWLADVGSDAL